MKKYKVLWFDDKHESLELIKREALSHNIELVGFKSNQSGMQELTSNYHLYQAVLIDARFYLTEDETGQGDETALIETQKELDIFPSKKFKYFVLTGQADIKKNPLFDKMFPTYYDKGDPDSIDELWNQLKQACNNDEDYQIQVEYQSVFNALSSLSRIKHRDIIDIIQNYNTSEHQEAPNNLGLLRNILEKIRDHYNDLGYIPDKVYNGGLNASIRFIAGKDNNYDLKSEILSPFMGKIAQDLNNIINDGSHEKDDLTLKVQEHIKSCNSRYVYRSCVNQLFELIIFSDYFIRSGVEPGLWNSKSEDSKFEGTVGKDGNTWFCDKYSIHHKMIEKKSLKVGDKVRILQYRESTIQGLKEKYPLFASNLEKI